jgi:hypothetical protein
VPVRNAGDGPTEIIHRRQQILGKIRRGEPDHILALARSSAPHVLLFGERAQKAILEVGRLGFQTAGGSFAGWPISGWPVSGRPISTRAIFGGSILGGLTFRRAIGRPIGGFAGRGLLLVLNHLTVSSHAEDLP